MYSDAVEPRRDPIARRQHVARDLRLHRVHVVHQGGRGNHAADVNGGGKQNDSKVVAKARLRILHRSSTG